MDRGTYSAASAGLVQLQKLELVNNNLANASTPGFKRQFLVGETQTFDQTLASAIAHDPYAKADHERTPGVVDIKSVTDFSQGPIRNTGNPFDVALRNPNDFFVVDTPGGQSYTRAGNFSLNSEGEVVTQDGLRVLGDGGPINANGPGAKILDDGSVVVNNRRVGRLQVVHFDDPSRLERTGGTRFKTSAGQVAPTPVEPQLASQSLEMSNVSAITSMIDLISVNRAFDMYTKSSKTIDDMNQMAINLSRPR